MSVVPKPIPDEFEDGEPNLRRTAEYFQGPLDIRSLGITVLAVLAIFYTVYVARGFLQPIVLAVLLKFVLHPVVRFVKRRLHLPEGLGAALVVLALIGSVAGAVYGLSGPAADWM